MKALKTIVIGAGLSAALLASAFAGEAGTVYTQVGTMGVGLGYSKSVGDDWALRGQANYLPSQSYTGDVGNFGSGSSANVKLDWSSFALLGDWYPFQSGFRVTGGVVVSGNKISIDVTNATVGSTSGLTAHGEVKVSESPAPYLGIGYMSKPKDAAGLGFNLDLGVMFGDPKVSLTAAGATQADIDAQKRKVQDAVDQLRNFPVLSVGVSYSF